MCTPGQVRLACRAVAVPGGRCFAGLGIDVDGGGAKVKRWSVAVTLSGGISARAAERVFGVPAAAGLARIGQLRHVRTGGLIAMLDAGGYARYDFRTAARPLEVTSARLWGEGSGRAGTRARPGMPAGMAGAGPRPGHGLLPGMPGLHGAAAGQP